MVRCGSPCLRPLTMPKVRKADGGNVSFAVSPWVTKKVGQKTEASAAPSDVCDRSEGEAPKGRRDVASPESIVGSLAYDVGKVPLQKGASQKHQLSGGRRRQKRKQKAELVNGCLGTPI